MARQTQMNPNGRQEAPPRAVSRSIADFWHDLMVLFELQGRLLAVELQETARESRWICALLVFSVCLAVSCIPVGLMGAAWLLAEQGALTTGQAFLIVFVLGWFAAGALIYGSLRILQQRVGLFRRSKAEWSESVRWAKATLKRLGPRPESGGR